MTIRTICRGLIQKSRLGSILVILMVAAAEAGCSFSLNPNDLKATPISLFNSAGGSAEGDITYDARLGRVIVPGASAAELALVDPESLGVDTLSGFGKPGQAASQAGVPSAATGKGMIFALDRGAMEVDVIDPSSGATIASAPVQAAPDLIRFVAATSEVWVTEKAKEQIEIFSIPSDDPFIPVLAGTISIPKGPEGLVIDRARGLAYTNQPETGTTVVIQVQTRGIIADWGNGCSQARGMALDEERGYLFVACSEGKVVMMDVLNGGAQITSQTYGAGIDSIGYNPQLQHVYLPSGASAILAIFGVVETPASGSTAAPTNTPGPTGAPGSPPAAQISLVRLGTADTALQASSVTADDRNNVWVYDPARGQVFRIQDTFPGSGAAP